MIEVHARLLSGAVFLAGEVVECHVTFRSPFRCSQSQSNSDIEEVLAWASAQIHCQCSVNDTVVKFPTSMSQEELATASKDTSFIPCRGESGHVVLSTKPKILFCDLKLLPGESKTYVYRETIPSNAPPTYRGQCIKYAYKITIGTQRVNAVIKLLKIPIRVLVMHGTCLRESQLLADSEELQVTPTNPFLQSQQKQPTIAITLQALDTVTARRSPSYFNITNQMGKVVRFCLLKTSFRLGEDIIGIFDFSKATVKCVQFSVTLVSEEELQDEYKGRAKQATTVAYNKHHEFCLHLTHTQMILPIPLMITPAFSTDIVSLRWRLHFEFVTTNLLPEIPQPESPNDSVVWQGPEMLDVQTMVWDLPINIYPTHPLQVAHGMPTKLEHMITI